MVQKLGRFIWINLLMNLKIRQAGPADATEIARVHVLSWQSSYVDLIDAEYVRGLQVGESESNWLRRLSEAEDIVLVAEVDGKIVGFVHGGKQREEGSKSEAELRAIYLLNEFQRKGIGSELFREFKAKLPAAGFHSLNVWVLEKNQAARDFYLAMGGKLSHERHFHKIGDKEYPLVEYVW